VPSRVRRELSASTAACALCCRSSQTAGSVACPRASVRIQVTSVPWEPLSRAVLEGAEGRARICRWTSSRPRRNTSLGTAQPLQSRCTKLQNVYTRSFLLIIVSRYGCPGKDGLPCDVSERTLREVYLKPWSAFVKAGGRGVMASHQSLNWMPMHANHRLLTQVLREEIGDRSAPFSFMLFSISVC
jgi:hypothetical protein